MDFSLPGVVGSASGPVAGSSVTGWLMAWTRSMISGRSALVSCRWGADATPVGMPAKAPSRGEGLSDTPARAACKAASSPSKLREDGAESCRDGVAEIGGLQFAISAVNRKRTDKATFSLFLGPRQARRFGAKRDGNKRRTAIR